MTYTDKLVSLIPIHCPCRFIHARVPPPSNQRFKSSLMYALQAAGRQLPGSLPMPDPSSHAAYATKFVGSVATESTFDPPGLNGGVQAW
mmetsp:Transcript_24090/g.61557  ORF Transcript_24090/g.61557 Transcript_24090/m.61557 type:complete len:89 (+) Transcript_24090:250-516(+)